MTDEEYEQHKRSLSMLRYSAVPVLRKPPGERVPEWRCACPDRKPWQRHRFAMDCQDPEEVKAWAITNRCSLKVAKEMRWLATEFAPIPSEEIPE